MPDDLKPNTVTGNKGGGLVDTGNSSFLTDFDKTGPGSIDTDEVDPLAKAYVEIGDSDGAKDILNEVVREGSPAQQAEAKKLIAGL